MSYVGDVRQDTMLARRTLHLSSLWKITPVLGSVLRYTDHDRTIIYDGQTYLSGASPIVDSRESQSGLSGGGSSMRGAIDASAISEESIISGAFDNAQVDETIINWRYPDVIGALLTRRFWIARFKRQDHTWEAELVTLADRLQRRGGVVVTRRCANQLGVGICGLGVNLESATYKKSGTVATLVTARQFTSSALGSTANMFKNGTITWLTGANTGIVSDIKSYTVATETFTLFLIPPNTVQVGDTFHARAGCDYELQGDCKTKFNNVINFVGADNMPGTAKATRLDV